MHAFIMDAPPALGIPSGNGRRKRPRLTTMIASAEEDELAGASIGRRRFSCIDRAEMMTFLQYNLPPKAEPSRT